MGDYKAVSEAVRVAASKNKLLRDVVERNRVADPLAAAEQGVIDAAVLARADKNYAHLLDLAVDELLHQRLRAAQESGT